MSTPPDEAGIARVARFVAQARKGDELARMLLEAAELVSDEDGCELYLVCRTRDTPEELWVSERRRTWTHHSRAQT